MSFGSKKLSKITDAGCTGFFGHFLKAADRQKEKIYE
jgi:hypothetical protein